MVLYHKSKDAMQWLRRTFEAQHLVQSVRCSRLLFPCPVHLDRLCLAVQLDFKLQHFPVRQLPGPDRSGNFPDRIQLKQTASTLLLWILLPWMKTWGGRQIWIHFLFCSKIANFWRSSSGGTCCPLYNSPNPQIYSAGRGGDVDLSDMTEKPLWFSSKVGYCKLKCASYASMDDNFDLIRKKGQWNPPPQPQS